MKKLILPLLLALLLGIGACHAEESLPPYSYPGSDPIEGAVANYLASDEFAGRFLADENSVTIPAPVILKTEHTDDEHAKVYGNFWVFNYVRGGQVLRMISGGEFPGIITLEKKDGAWTVKEAEFAGDGEDYGADLIRFSDGDEALENQYFLAGDGASVPAKEAVRSFILDYVTANGLDIVAYQNPFWPPEPLQDIPHEPVRGEIDEGAYVIRVPVAGSLGQWQAFAPEAEGAAVRLASEETVDSYFTARFEPANDGTATVSLKHHTGIACDAEHTFDILVEDGKVKETVGGSYTASPADEDLNRYITGTWLEKDTQFTQLTVYRDPYMGWNSEVTSPMTHGAYVFRANMEYDCDLECFVYHDGRFWDLTPDNDDPTAAEPAVTGSQGTFSFIVPDGAEAGDTGAICLEWASDRNTIPVTIFEHSDSVN